MRYVRHKSGQGETWEVHTEQVGTWGIKQKPDWLYLPKSEYVEVSAPDRWVDVTAECELTEGMDGAPNGIMRNQWNVGYVVKCYRLRKVHVSNWHNEERTVMPEWAFIVERKEPACLDF